MTTDQDDFENVRPKDHTVLTRIRNGDDDVQKITSTTTLNNSQVNNSFNRLVELDLIKIGEPDDIREDGMVSRTVNGTRQVFQAPKKAILTEKAQAYFESCDRNTDPENYQILTQSELSQKTQELDTRITELETQLKRLEDKLEQFRRQIAEELN